MYGASDDLFDLHVVAPGHGVKPKLLTPPPPPCFWEYARQHYCLMENVLIGRGSVVAGVDKRSPWEKVHGEPFDDKLIPIGAKVYIKPSETKGDTTSKMEPTSIAGVFAGYELSSGCRCSGIYMVWSLEEFVDIDLSSKSSFNFFCINRGNLTKQMQLICSKKVCVFSKIRV